MIDLTPKGNIDVAPQPAAVKEDVKKTNNDVPVGEQAGKLKLRPPIFSRAMSDANGYGVATITTLDTGVGAGGKLSKDVTAFAGIQGNRLFLNNVSEIPREVLIEDPLMNRPLEYNMGLSGFSVSSGVNYNVAKLRHLDSWQSSADVYTTGGLDLLKDRGGAKLGTTLSTGNRHGELRLNVERGRDIVKSEAGYALMPSQSLSLDGSVRQEIGGGKTLIAMAGMNKSEMTFPKSTQPGAINYGDGVVKSDTYYANVVLAKKGGSVSVNVSASGDNMGYESRTAGLGVQVGATSVNANVVCRASSEEGSTDKGYKCNNVSLNGRHTW